MSGVSMSTVVMVCGFVADVFRYDERIDVVETRIAAHLRDQLGTAKKANEMFRIFSRYNALFVRPHIQGAIREYQTQLIQRVKEDIDGLHQKFKVCRGMYMYKVDSMFQVENLFEYRVSMPKVQLSE